MRRYTDLTLEGKKRLEDELAELISGRAEITERIATARAFGDLSENEEYSSARGDQKVAEGRILEIQDILKNAKIIKTGAADKIKIGVTVTMTGEGKEFTYTIVGAVEANPLEGKISDVSPVGKALIGLKIGEEATLPNGKRLKIKSIS